MRILWLVNKKPKYLESINNKSIDGRFSGILSNIISIKDVEVSVVYPSKSCKAVLYKSFNNVKHYEYPEKNEFKYNKKTKQIFKNILDVVKPDIIHIFGTEYPRSFSMMEANESSKIIVSIAGLISLIEKHYLANIPRKISHGSIISRLLSLFLPIQLPYLNKNAFNNRGLYEIRAIQSADYVIGKSNWDYSYVKSINPNIKYFKSNQVLRKHFYNESWNHRNSAKHSILLVQGGYPLKGLHFLIEAVYILKKKYSDISLRICGSPLIKKRSYLKSKFVDFINPYQRYIKELINKYNLMDNIIFTGVLSEEDMVNEYLRANVNVVSSSIENSSNAIIEGMILGVPTVASFVGGSPDLINHEVNGYLYPYDDVNILAFYLSKLFDDDLLCNTFSSKSRSEFLIKHNAEDNINKIIENYKIIFEDANIERLEKNA